MTQEKIKDRKEIKNPQDLPYISKYRILIEIFQKKNSIKETSKLTGLSEQIIEQYLKTTQAKSITQNRGRVETLMLKELTPGFSYVQVEVEVNYLK